jgi:hypothetical protein
MTDQRQEYAQVLLSETREELNRADAKVSVLLATTAVAASIIAGAIATGRWTPTHLATWAQVIWWLGVSIATAGFVTLARALVPRVHVSDDQFPLGYFGHVARLQSTDELSKCLSEVSGQRLERTVSQLWVVSRIVAGKYHNIRLALHLFGIAAVLLVIAAGAG